MEKLERLFNENIINEDLGVRQRVQDHEATATAVQRARRLLGNSTLRKSAHFETGSLREDNVELPTKGRKWIVVFRREV